MSVPDAGQGEARGALNRFRQGFYDCLTRRGNALFDLADAALCAEGPVRALAELSLVSQHRRGHGGLYAALNQGQVDTEELGTLLARQPLPRGKKGRLVLAVDVSPWLRPDARTSPERLFCHCFSRGMGGSQLIAGWPYSVVAALGSGRSSWTAPLDAVRLGPTDDAIAVTAAQLRRVLERLIAAGQYRPGDPDIVIVVDAGYDVTYLAHVLADLPVVLAGRQRSNRVFYHRAPVPGAGRAGRPAKHGAAFRFRDQASQPDPDEVTTTDTDRYGTLTARAWDQLHQEVTRRSAWAEHEGPLPVIEGTVIHLAPERLPGRRNGEPLWLFATTTGLSADEVNEYWQAFLRRFDLEHTFRFLKQTLGWTAPQLRDPHAADRWTWLLLACCTQLRLARGLVADRRLPWERPLAPEQLTPARVRRGFRHIHHTTCRPAAAPKPSKPGPGRPKGKANTHPAPHHSVGKTRKKTRKKTTPRST